MIGDDETRIQYYGNITGPGGRSHMEGLKFILKAMRIYNGKKKKRAEVDHSRSV